MACPKCGFPNTTGGCENGSCENYSGSKVYVGGNLVGAFQQWSPSGPITTPVFELPRVEFDPKRKLDTIEVEIRKVELAPSMGCKVESKPECPVCENGTSRAVTDFWMEGDSLHVVYADDNSHTVFHGIEMVSYHEEGPADPDIFTEREVKLTVRGIEDPEEKT